MIKKKNNIFLASLVIIIALLVLFSIFTGCKNPETKTTISVGSTSSGENITVETVTSPSVTATTGTSTSVTATETTNEISFSFAVSGDSRPASDDQPQPKNFIDILNSMKKFNPSFYINTGDIIMGTSSDAAVIKRQFADFLKAVSILNCHVYVAAGNHEISTENGRNSFDKLFSSEGKTYYYFDYKNVYFIVLDAYEEGNWGAIKGEELSWLKSLLPTLKAEKVFVFLHPPVYSYLNPDCITDGSKKISFSDKKNQDDIRELFKDNNVDGVFSGHEHMFHMQKKGNTEYVITALSGAEPYVSKTKAVFTIF